MANENGRREEKMIDELRKEWMEEKDKHIECIILDIPLSKDPDDPIRRVIDEVLGDFVEIETPNGSFFFPTSILRS